MNDYWLTKAFNKCKAGKCDKFNEKDFICDNYLICKCNDWQEYIEEHCAYCLYSKTCHKEEIKLLS